MPEQSLNLIKCGHCSNLSTMEHRGSATIIAYEDHERNLTEENVYEVLQCPACKQVTIRVYMWVDGVTEPEDLSPEDFTYLYPPLPKVPIGLPDEVKTAYESAQKVRLIDANAYAVLIGRVLELVCEDRKAKGKDLYKKLSDLASRGEIPSNLVDVAQNLRNLRNVGAHAALGGLTKEEVPILDDLINALLEYVYSASPLIDRAEAKLKQIRKAK